MRLWFLTSRKQSNQRKAKEVRRTIVTARYVLWQTYVIHQTDKNIMVTVWSSQRAAVSRQRQGGDEHCVTWGHGADFFCCIDSSPVGRTMWPNSAPLWRAELGRICSPANCEQPETPSSASDCANTHRSDKLVQMPACLSAECGSARTERRGPKHCDCPWEAQAQLRGPHSLPALHLSY